MIYVGIKRQKVKEKIISLIRSFSEIFLNYLNPIFLNLWNVEVCSRNRVEISGFFGDNGNDSHTAGSVQYYLTKMRSLV